MVQFEVALFHCLILVFVLPISNGRTLFQVISLQALELYFSLEFDENPFKLTEIMDDQSSERATAASTNEKPVKRRGRPPGTKNNPNRHLTSKLRKSRVRSVVLFELVVQWISEETFCKELSICI